MNISMQLRLHDIVDSRKLIDQALETSHIALHFLQLHFHGLSNVQDQFPCRRMYRHVSTFRYVLLGKSSSRLGRFPHLTVSPLPPPFFLINQSSRQPIDLFPDIVKRTLQVGNEQVPRFIVARTGHGVVERGFHVGDSGTEVFDVCGNGTFGAAD